MRCGERDGAAQHHGDAAQWRGGDVHDHGDVDGDHGQHHQHGDREAADRDHSAGAGSRARQRRRIIRTFDTVTGLCSASDTDTVQPIADLVITKTDGVTTVIAAGSTTYTVVVTNNGPSEVTSAPVTDPVQTGLTIGAGPVR